MKKAEAKKTCKSIRYPFILRKKRGKENPEPGWTA